MMFEKIFIIYGINGVKHTVNSIITGFIITIFSGIIIHGILTIFYYKNILELFIKIFHLLTIITIFTSYTFVKFNTQHIFEMNNELNKYYVKSDLEIWGHFYRNGNSKKMVF